MCSQWERTGPAPKIEGAPNSQNEPFLDACYNGDLEAVREAIANQSLVSDDLQEGLELATTAGHAEVVAALFDAGAKITQWLIDFLPGEHSNQNPLVVRKYLDCGLDPNAQTGNGEPLLRMMGNAACTRELLSRGADPNLVGRSGVSPLASAIASNGEAHSEQVELLVEYGAKLSPDLYFSSVAPRVRQQERMTRFLIDKGVDPNATSPHWGTPLHMAVRHGKANLVKLLLEAGADPAASTTGLGVFSPNQTPQDVAEERISDETRRQEILDLLRSHARE